MRMLPPALSVQNREAAMRVSILPLLLGILTTHSLTSLAADMPPRLWMDLPHAGSTVTHESEGRDGSPAVDCGLREGWPVNLGAPGAGLPYTPTIADANDDGAFEIFVTGMNTFALDGFGNFLPGWPTSEQAYLGYGTNGNLPGPSVADVDRDGDPEVMWSLRDWWAGSAAIWSFNGRDVDGADMPGFPLFAPDDYSNALASPFVLADTDGDHDLEAWSAHTLGNTGIYYRVSALDDIGNILFTTDLDSSETVLDLYFGDLDGDGAREMFAITWLSPEYRLYAFNGDGGVRPGYPLTLFTLPSGYLSLGPPVPFDMDGDDDLEILCGYNLSGGLATANCLHHDGSPVAGFPFTIATGSQVLYLGLGDIDADGIPELLATINILSGAYSMQVHELDGPVLWIAPLPDWPKGFPAVADLNSDQYQDICVATGGGEVYALDGPSGSILSGFPKTMLSPSISGVAVGDIDGDGYFELVAATWDGWVYAWDVAGEAIPDFMDWPMRGINAMNTGVFGDEGVVSSAVDPPIDVGALRLARNPFRSRVEFVFPGTARGSTLDIYDVRGHLIERLAAGNGDRMVWSPGPERPSGVYLARMRDSGTSEVVKLIYLR